MSPGIPSRSSRTRTRLRRRRALDAAIYRILGVPPGRHVYSVGVERVPMRDGVVLLTDVYVPAARSRGTVLIRTPYGRTGLIARLTAGYYAAHGYRVVNQSCRGTFGSGGTFEPFDREIEDGADAVAWLRRQPWFDGRFAVCGASYLGHTAWAVMVDPPPELVAAVISACAHDPHWVTHGSGAVSLQDLLGLMDAFGHLEDGLPRTLVRAATVRRRLRTGFDELPLVRAEETVLAGTGTPYREWLAATEADDACWRRMRLGPALERVDVPVLLQDGWQDRFPEQMIEQYERLARRGVDVALTIGPWTHVQLATKGAGVVMAETLDWLAEHLAGTGSRRRRSPVRVYVRGAEEWRDLPAWPPSTHERVLYLHPYGRLDPSQPAASAGPSGFTYDPSDPTPAVGGQVIDPAVGGYRDNRGLEERDDVLTFTGAPLVEPVEVMGSPVVEVVHRTDNPHGDLFVRLCEVRGNGRSVNVSDGFRRLSPDASDGTIQLRLEATAHRFVPGVRIRLQISGGAHPRFARNLGTNEDPATSTRLVSSRRTIFHGDGGVSRVLLPCSPDS